MSEMTALFPHSATCRTSVRALFFLACMLCAVPGVATAAAFTNAITVQSYAYDGAGATPHTGYPDSDAELTDGALPTTATYQNIAWVGFNDAGTDTPQPRVTFDLGQTCRVDLIDIAYLETTQLASITPPDAVWVSFSTNGVDFTAATAYTNEFDHTVGDEVRTARLDVGGHTASRVTLDFRNETSWTFLGEVTIINIDTNPPVVLTDDFSGQVIDTNSWIEHDPGTKVTQSNALLVASSGSWSDGGLESVAQFLRDDELIIETVAKVSTAGTDATPIGYGDWNPSVASYFLSFRQTGSFYTWKGESGYSGTDTGVAYTTNTWYRFVMHLDPTTVRFEVYEDANGDGDFDDDGEDADLFASAPGRQIVDADYDYRKVRFNNNSAGLMTLKSVEVRGVSITASHEALLATMDLAQSAHDAAAESEANGDYPVGSKATLQAAIDAAQAVDDNVEATAEDLAAADSALLHALMQFRHSLNGGLPFSNHIIGTGQSLSVGWNGGPSITKTQPYNNMMLSERGQTGTNLVPLIEGANLNGANVETISSGLGNTLTALSPGTNYVSIVTRDGQGSKSYAELQKGTVYYQKGIDQIRKAMNATYWPNGSSFFYRVTAVTVVHGEKDNVNNTGPYYAGYLMQWQADYENDARALTGQTNDVPMFLCQVSSHTKQSRATSLIPGAQLWAAENSRKHYLVAPKYFLAYSDGVHLTGPSYRHLGEYYGKAMKRVLVDGADWRPLLPTKIQLDGTGITVDFHVPVPPLQVDTNLVLAREHFGFEYTDDSSSANITNVTLVDADTILITLDQEPSAPGQRLRYAYTGTSGSWAGCDQPGSARGNIRDSDATPSLYTNSLYNWLVHFDHPIPFNPAHDDVDSDGLPDRWENRMFGDTNAVQDVDGDRDGDGVSNHDEWLGGSDPDNRRSLFKFSRGNIKPDRSYSVAWGMTAERQYELQSATSLVSPIVWTPVLTTNGNGNMASFAVPGGSNLYFKLSSIVE